ncbi:MAG: hypothetical protein MUC56_15585 [Thermoanaerobaculales bacterium]|jgi:hypothetical protein|nr:hypothetical protein [Thermoanaerobaculales bacterium]
MDFERVLALIRSHFDDVGEPFGVVGALGVAARGFSRTTFDVDIVAPASAQAALIEFLEAAGYRTEHRSAGYSNHVHADRDLGRVDVVYVGGETAERIFAGVEMRPGAGGVDMPVPRAEHLAAMKLFGIKNEPTQALQDLEDVRRILELPRVDREEIRGYFNRYGLEALLERLD